MRHRFSESHPVVRVPKVSKRDLFSRAAVEYEYRYTKKFDIGLSSYLSSAPSLSDIREFLDDVEEQTAEGEWEIHVEGVDRNHYEDESPEVYLEVRASRPATDDEIADYERWRARKEQSEHDQEVARLEQQLARLKGTK